MRPHTGYSGMHLTPHCGHLDVIQHEKHISSLVLSKKDHQDNQKLVTYFLWYFTSCTECFPYTHTHHHQKNKSKNAVLCLRIKLTSCDRKEINDKYKKKQKKKTIDLLTPAVFLCVVLLVLVIFRSQFLLTESYWQKLLAVSQQLLFIPQ